MFRKILIGIAVVVMAGALPFAFASPASSTSSNPCLCCGEACVCEQCVCDGLECSCNLGGPCACTNDCCADCCA